MRKIRVDVICTKDTIRMVNVSVSTELKTKHFLEAYLSLAFTAIKTIKITFVIADGN